MPIARRSFLTSSLAVSAAGLALPNASAFSAGRALASTGTPAPNGDVFSAVSTDGLRLAVQAYGSPADPAIVLVHGLNQSRLSWDRQIKSALVDRFRVITYDLRGHGDSDRPADLAAYADGTRWGDDLAAVIEAAGVARPVVAGWSLGGFVIGEYLAKRGGDGLAGVNLINAVVGFEPSLFRPTNIFGPLMASEDFATRVQATRDFLAACFAVPPPREEFERMLVFNGMVPREVQIALGRFESESETLARGYRSLQAPVLVTFGQADRLVGVPMVDRTRALVPQAEASWYEGIGHTPFYENAERYNRELAAFAEQVQTG
ncbi:alpha/beta fold hydrolase [Marinivivus vitaminiproducens]|uniref:alpha/beta fold hydrolase n=1 Tax=Marinivivus vitaminiproducens TaxID=3035935 RepID=UPI00279A30EF|nr:alpha/beta hydrolase [Geminicoccaceae bacterium SCSIO 64248]